MIPIVTPAKLHELVAYLNVLLEEKTQFENMTKFSEVYEGFLEIEYVGSLDIYYLEELISFFKEDVSAEEMAVIMEEYKQKLSQFLTSTTVKEFHDEVHSVVKENKPLCPPHMKKLSLKLPKKFAATTTLKNIE